ncbi:MAG TPA: glycosyltransferase family 2 protein [Bacteroidota bacterium]|jgi:glycosyltransferase involved in cell wall biosynthesis|nr:glycosyltransferase family 2 protein [Bacteroidota bacterium]
MVREKKVIVVMPAYNAARTLAETYREIPHDIVDEVILVDDASIDDTVRIAKGLGITTIAHEQNLGYGGNQKTCYATALEHGADIVVMLHPDYQYTPKIMSSMVYLIESGVYDVVLGSRILGGEAVQGGMPLYKYIGNRILTLLQNLLMSAKLSEYHTGYRAFSREVLQRVPWKQNSNDFVFDNQMLSQIVYLKFKIAEVTCPAKYFEEASSINFQRSVRYGLGCLLTALQFRLTRMGVLRGSIFDSR